MTAWFARSARARVWTTAGVAGILLCASAVASAADAMSISQFVAQRAKWSDFATSGTRLKVEGRYSNFSAKLLRFTKCDDLNFVWNDDEQPFPIEPSNLRSRTLEVYGRFVIQLGKPVFRVDGMRELPADEETLRTRKSAIRNDPATAWYALGDWALARGEFYADVDMENEARQIFAEGIERELRTLSDDAARRQNRPFRKVPHVWPA